MCIGQLLRFKHIWETIVKTLDARNETEIRRTQAKTTLGSAYGYLNDIIKMELMEREVVEVRNLTYGPEASETIQAVIRHIHTLNFYIQDYEKAMEKWEYILRVRRAQLEPHHYLISSTLYYIAQTHMFQGRHDEAAPRLEEALEIQHIALEAPRIQNIEHDPEHPTTVDIMEILAYCYGVTGGPSGFVVLDQRRRILDLRKKWRRHSAPDTLYAMYYLAMSFMQQG